MRTAFLTLGLLACFGLPAIGVGTMSAHAQSTEQTDQSEEDWRKSRKKDDSSDILDAILNPNGQGVGYNQIPTDPIESLPQESRRHLMRERAKLIATTEPDETPDAPYTPSEEAKIDPKLAAQEEEAWTVIMTDLKASDNPDAGSPDDGPNKIAVSGQGGSPSNSPLRGGSTQSVAEILAQIKGMKSAGNGSNGPAPTTDAGSQPNPGQGSQSSSPSSSEAQSENQGEADAMAEAQQATDASQSDSDAQDSSDQKAENAAEAASEATAENAAAADTKPKTMPEPIGPLERLKKEQSASATVGSQTSASDFLKTSEKPD